MEHQEQMNGNQMGQGQGPTNGNQMDQDQGQMYGNQMVQEQGQTAGPTPSGQKQPPNNMAAASLVMGILAVVTCCCYYGGFIFGGLGILFALLSKTEEKFCGQAKAGLALSAAGVVMALLAGIIFFLVLYGSQDYFSGNPIQNLPAIPEITQPDLDNLLTIFRRLPLGGGPV